MKTNFSKKQLQDNDNKSSEKIFRKCVHCGFCNATCPTYDLLGDELDGPRGRIYMIKDMLENSKLPNEKIVKHIDRCLSCYSCMTTCPSGVNYMHLVDHARNYGPALDKDCNVTHWILPHNEDKETTPYDVKAGIELYKKTSRNF